MEYSPEIQQAYECAYAANDTFDRVMRLQQALRNRPTNDTLPPGESVERMQQRYGEAQCQFAYLQDMAGMVFSAIDNYPQPIQNERPVFDYGNPDRSLDEIRSYCAWREVSSPLTGNYVRVVVEQIAQPAERNDGSFSVIELEEKVRQWVKPNGRPFGIGPGIIAFCVDYLNTAHLPEKKQIFYRGEETNEITSIDPELFVENYMPEPITVGDASATVITKETLADYGDAVTKAGAMLPFAAILSAIAKQKKVPIPADHKPAILSPEVTYLGKRQTGPGQRWGIAPEAFIAAITSAETLQIDGQGNYAKALGVAKHYVRDLQEALGQQAQED